jgi:hypothetical protein
LGLSLRPKKLGDLEEIKKALKLQDAKSPEWLQMRKKAQVLAAENAVLVDLTFHSVPASLLTEFAERIVQPYYRSNMNVAIQDRIHKALANKNSSFLT